MHKDELIKKLEKLEIMALRALEKIKYYEFEPGSSYTQVDMVRAYHTGLGDMEEVWRKVITELKKKIQEET